MLSLYRRHLHKCPHRGKGQSYTTKRHDVTAMSQSAICGFRSAFAAAGFCFVCFVRGMMSPSSFIVA
jgi:hypothetical protein